MIFTYCLIFGWCQFCDSGWKWVIYGTEQRADETGGKTTFSPKQVRQKSSWLPESNQIRSAVWCPSSSHSHVNRLAGAEKEKLPLQQRSKERRRWLISPWSWRIFSCSEKAATAMLRRLSHLWERGRSRDAQQHNQGFLACACVCLCLRVSEWMRAPLSVWGPCQKCSVWRSVGGPMEGEEGRKEKGGERRWEGGSIPGQRQECDCWPRPWDCGSFTHSLTGTCRLHFLPQSRRSLSWGGKPWKRWKGTKGNVESHVSAEMRTYSRH